MRVVKVQRKAKKLLVRYSNVQKSGHYAQSNLVTILNKIKNLDSDKTCLTPTKSITSVFNQGYTSQPRCSIS